jgi:hypothetical protein
MPLRRTAALLATVAVAATPAAALAAGTSTTTLKQRATTHCAKLEKKDGKAKFEKAYGKKRAMATCIARYERAHSKKK